MTSLAEKTTTDADFNALDRSPQENFGMKHFVLPHETKDTMIGYGTLPVL